MNRRVPRLAKQFKKPSRTKQAFKDEVDINRIMQKYQKTGLITHVKNVQARFGDFSGVEDYQNSLNAVITAQQSFEALPAKIRDRFANDPLKLLAFLSDESNIDEAINLGLLEKRNTEQSGASGEVSTPEPTKPPEGA